MRGRDGRYSIGVSDGQIAAVQQEPLSGRVEIDAGGNLVTEPFVNAHLHLCKAYTHGRAGDAVASAYAGGSMGAAMSAVELASAVKDGYGEDAIEANARRAMFEAVRHGVRHVLAFVDVDTKAQLTGVGPLVRLREEFEGVAELYIVAFPQQGLLRDPGAEDLVRQAIALGADVVGGIPWIEHSDDDAREHISRMCALAAEHGRMVAMLVDDAGDPALRTTEMLAAEMIRQGLEGRGIAHHARAVGSYAEPSVRRLANLARQAGLTFVSSPHTGPAHLPAFQLADLGVPVAFGQDDIEDTYYPFGRNNMLEVAFLAAHSLGAVTHQALERVFDMVTGEAAQVLGLNGPGLAVGGAADLVVLDGSSVRDVLIRHNPPRYVVAGGRIVAVNSSSTAFHLGARGEQSVPAGWPEHGAAT
ncbi:amidohydrolase family protein [Phytoactinopolyspora halotolerans]|uniref:Amidohydrolase family protein n=1 Tax=Phytoactinopolyspora halotolerans TaxID=1981512 RepID=A0A6L9SC53_9ACTN|nr:amidohydrolase family protein [Phytoactinopolyspora halotolerans]